MFPTLKPGDILKVVPYKDSDIGVGDVLVFNSSYGSIPIVHRVVTVSQEGIKTKGDNNQAIDRWVLRPTEIVGRVVSAERKNRTIRIANGNLGRMHTVCLNLMKRIETACTIIFSPAYRLCAKQGIFRKQISHKMDTWIFCLKRQKGTELQLFWGRRMIGRLHPGQDEWHIKRPFRLFIDESALPKVEDVDGKRVSSGAQGIEQRVDG